LSQNEDYIYDTLTGQYTLLESGITKLREAALNGITDQRTINAIKAAADKAETSAKTDALITNAIKNRTKLTEETMQSLANAINLDYDEFKQKYTHEMSNGERGMNLS